MFLDFLVSGALFCCSMLFVPCVCPLYFLHLGVHFHEVPDASDASFCSSTIIVTDSNFHNMVQIGMLEDLRQRTLQGVTRLQALYKGYKVRLMYRQKRKMTIYLQSCKFSLSVFSHG